LGFTLLVLITSIQMALITIPYTIYGNRLAGESRRQYAGSTLVHHALLGLLAVAGLLIASAVCSLTPQAAELTPVIWTLAGMIPFLLLREFVRRFAFAHLRAMVAAMLDAAVAVMQISGMLCLAWLDRLSAVSGYAVMGLACAVAAGAAMRLMKNEFVVRRQQVLPELKQNWRLGRWIFASQMTSVVQSYSVHWLLALMLGTAATGVFAACMTVLLVANPFIMGIGNVLEPMAARALTDGGGAELSRVVWKTTLFLCSVMAVYCGIAVFAGEIVIAWLYHGPQYGDQGAAIAALALGVFVGCFDIAACHGLRVIERPDVSFKGSLLALVVTLVMALLLVRPWGVLGGACALIAGNAAAAILRCTAFCRLVVAERWQLSSA
jgi:O-antigen/teichoic acid export membrane protein